MTTRRVIVLGAGFSFDARFPLQSQILPKVLSPEPDLVKMGPDGLAAFAAASQLKPFVSDLFGASTLPTLEDLFTLLDQCEISGTAIRQYSNLELMAMRRELLNAILLQFHQASEAFLKSPVETYYVFASRLIRDVLDPGRHCAVVLVNWDPLVEDVLTQIARKYGLDDKIGVDFGCDVNPIWGATHRTARTQAASSISAIKVLKLHGSVNWLHCQTCGQLFTGLGSSRPSHQLYSPDQQCKFCAALTGKALSLESLVNPSIGLSLPSVTRYLPFIVSPTFLKRFDNFHIAQVWNEAKLELLQADEVTFVGYSLPLADYHLRALLRSTVRSDAKVRVYLAPQDEPRRPGAREYYAGTRYQTFFAGKDCIISYGGLAEFCNATSFGSVKTNVARAKALLRRTSGG